MAQPKPDEQELVSVFDTQEESEAMIIQGLLDTAGIQSIITGMDAPQDVLPGVGGVLVRVTADKAEEAKLLIKEYSISGAAEEGELNSEGVKAE